jgi:hypothetical protein
MFSRRLKTMTFAVAAIGAVVLGGSKQARADILVTVVSGGTTSTFDGSGSNTNFTTPSFNIDGYTGTVHAVTTTYPGNAAGASISTTVNITSLGNANPQPMTTYVQLVASSPNTGSPFTNPLLAWTAPTTPFVNVSAGASLAPQTGLSSGSVATTTYYNSPPATNGLSSTPVVTATQPTPTGSSPLSSVLAGNAGTYSLGQVLVLSGVAGTVGLGFNFGGTSAVTPSSVPEPSTMALGGLGALGLIGYGLRRRKAAGV